MGKEEAHQQKIARASRLEVNCKQLSLTATRGREGGAEEWTVVGVGGVGGRGDEIKIEI